MAEYRLWPATSGPGSQASDPENYTMGTQFKVTTTGMSATKIHFWASTNLAGTYAGRIYLVNVGGDTGSAVSGTDVTFGSITGPGWNTATMAAPVGLTMNQAYVVVVFFTTDNGYTATGDYWGSGAGTAGITNGPLTAPSTAAAVGNKQGAFVAGTSIAFPESSFNSGNYWVDVTVIDPVPFAALPLGGLSLRVGAGYTDSYSTTYVGDPLITHPSTASFALGTVHLGATAGSVPPAVTPDVDGLNLSLWAVSRTDGTLTALPHFTSLRLSRERNGLGKISVSYPYYGRNFALLADNITSDDDLEVEIWVSGKRAGALRGLLTDTSGDDTAEDAVWTFEGYFLELLLDEVLAWAQAGAEKQELIFSGVTAGTIAATILGQAQVRGGLIGFSRDFSTTLDSAGAAWGATVSATYSPTTTFLEVLQDLVEIGLIDGFEVTAGRVLRMWKLDGAGTDRTTGSTPLIFRRGQNLTQSPRRHTVRNSGTTSLVAGSDNLYASTHNATAAARRGRRIEIGGSANALKDLSSVGAYATQMALAISPGQHEVTHEVVFGDGHPRPLIDFFNADWVWSDTRGDLERLRAQQLELELGPDGYRGVVVLNTPITDRMVALARKLKRMSAGTAVVGTSTIPGDVDDGKAPAQVLGVTATSDAYFTNAGILQAAVQAGWTAVTTNSDATAADDIVGYFPAYRYTSGGLPGDWQIQAQVDGTVADWSGVAPGRDIEVRVAAVDKYGRLGAWAAAFALTTDVDATPPPTPSTPVVDSYLGILTVTWDGLGSVGEAQPVDFDHVDVHISTSSGFTAGSGNRIDQLRGKGVIPWTDGTYGVTYYAKLIAYDRSGNPSAASSQGSATLVQAGDGDISAVSIGKLTAGVLSAIMTVSSTIRTASSGPRWQADSTGFFCSDGTVNVLAFTIATGLLELMGKLIAGAGAGTGSTIVVDPASGAPVIDMYPSSTLDRTRVKATIANDPLGGTAACYIVEALNSSGVNDGPIFVATPSTTWITFRDGADYVGGALKVFPVGTGTGIGAALNYSSGTGIDVNVSVTPTGGIDLIADGDPITIESHGNPTTIDTGGAPFSVTTGGEDVTIDTGASGTFLVPDGGSVGLYGPTTGTKLILDTDGSVLLGSTGNSFIQINPGGTIEFYEGGVGYSSLSTLKSFVIDHPTDPDRLLVHVCTESPRAGVEYWGDEDAVIIDGHAQVSLPAYFEALTEPDGRQVQLTPVDELCMVAASPIRGGTFTIRCSGPDGTRVSWLVKATRRAEFTVEPLRSEVTVGGAGPYRYIQETG